LRCKPHALGALMADHTQLDWRPVLPLLELPCLNVVGGCRWVGGDGAWFWDLVSAAAALRDCDWCVEAGSTLHYYADRGWSWLSGTKKP
jgi:hypothetical protein